MDTYKVTEAKLYNYPYKKAEIRNLEIELDDFYDLEKYPSLQYDRIPTATNINSNVENTVVKIETSEKIKKLSYKIKKLRNQVLKIENALEILKDDEREIIELIYFNRKPIHEVAEIKKLHIMTVVRKKKNILNKYLIPLISKKENL